ncbi:MAG TPA: hypothetical protein VNZ57_14840 [Longimicrobiales bacterium]|nr:hypothetical protein [Longimicrobiales bacterium]
MELLTVALLIAVSSAIVLPRIDWEGRQFRSAVVDVQSVLVRAQRYAVLRQHDVIVVFERDAMRLTVHADANNDGAIQADEEVTVHELAPGIVFDRAGRPPLDWGGSAVSFADGRITFHRDGSASARGGVYLSSVRRSRTGGWSWETVAMQVERSTGRVTCLQYLNSAWVTPCR